MLDGRIATPGVPDKQRIDVPMVIGQVKPDAALRSAGSKPLDAERNADTGGDQTEDGAAVLRFLDDPGQEPVPLAKRVHVHEEMCPMALLADDESLLRKRTDGDRIGPRQAMALRNHRDQFVGLHDARQQVAALERARQETDVDRVAAQCLDLVACDEWDEP